MSYDPEKVIAIAKLELGYLEKSLAAYKADPSVIYRKKDGAGHDNVTKYGVEMHKIFPKVMDLHSPYCDAFVDWCFMQAYGVSNARKLLRGEFDDYTVASADLYRKAGAWYQTPEIGDQIFFRNSTRICHTGLVVDIVQSTGMVVTVEGNTSNSAEVISNGGSVCQKYYKLDNARIAGYGRPAYGRQEAFAFTPHWVKSGADWYYRVADGQNAHGWKLINGYWYLFDDKGKMLTGLQENFGEWFALTPREKSADLEGALCKADKSGALYPWKAE